MVPDEVEQHLLSRGPRAIAQRVVFLRDTFARNGTPRTEPEVDPLRSHACLALTIDSVHVEVSFELCPEAEADVKNLRSRIADPTALLELTSLLDGLPEEFSIGVIGVPSFPRARSAAGDDIRALLDDSRRNGRPLWIGWSIKREVAISHSSELDEQLADALVALAHVYKLVAWAPDNDRIGASRRGAWRAGRGQADERRELRAEARSTKRRSRVGRHPVKTEGSRREREDARRALPRADGEALGRPPAPDEPRDDADRSRPDLLAARPVPPRRPILPTTLRARGARAPSVIDVDPSLPIEKGSRVCVLSGPFANKIGVVQELDGKGRARVRLGLLAATLDLKDIVASSEGTRPMLASSHRRPRTVR